MLNYCYSICLCSIFFLTSWAQPTAVDGILDLRQVTFQEETTLSINAGWETYQGEVLENEEATALLGYENPSDGMASALSHIENSNDNEGIVTYVLRVLMPEQSRSLSVKIPVINTAYDLYVNGELVSSVGQVGSSYESSQPYWKPVTQSIKLVPGKNEFRLVISNFHHDRAGMFQPLIIGSETYLNSKRNLHVGGMLFLAGCLLVSGVFALGLFWFKTSDLFGLMFFFFSMAYCVWVVSSSYYVIPTVFDTWSWFASLKIEYASIALAVSFYGYFIKSVLDDKIKWWPFHLSSSISLIFIGITLFASSNWSSMLYPYYIALVVVAFGVLIVGAMRYIDFHHKLTWINFVGFVALMLVIVLRIVSSHGFIEEHYRLDLIGNVTFVLSQALFLAIMFGRRYRMSSLAALAAARTRDEFLNTMSHELKTPMNAILGMTAFLENSKLNSSQKDKLRAIKNNGESLMTLINDVLSISEVGSGNLALKNSILSIDSCLDSALSLSKQHMRKEGVVFTSYIDPRIPKHVKGDSSRIKQVLMHILNHSFKNTSKGAVEVRTTLYSEDENQVKVQFEISDTGSRAKYNQSQGLFNLFTSSENLGLEYQHTETGIRVAKELIELMGGELDYMRQKSKTNHVTFVLPLERYNEAEQRRITSIHKTSDVDTSLKILYAEDNPVNQKLIILMLQSMGLKVDIANNGQEALEMAAKKYYNIILMDISMPVMDGLEASQHIIQNSSSRPIIIAATANMAEVDKRKCFEAGMNDFLSKPINQEELKLAILKWQGLKQYLDDSDDNIIQLSS